MLQSPTLGSDSPDQAALAAMERAVTARPEDARAWYELGRAYGRLHRQQEALAALDNCLTLAPDHIDALAERGVALLGLRNLAAAADAFEEVLACEPLHTDALFMLGNVRYRQGRLDEAVALWRHTVAHSDAPLDALENLAIAFNRMDLRDEQRRMWRQVLEHDPRHATALHHLAALNGESPARASTEYVVRLFDAFAPEFDEVLNGLGYQGPQVLAQLLPGIYGVPAATLEILDGGCGTGLCGPLLRPWARTLIGVDLSGAMLEHAHRRGHYDELVQGELVEYFTQHPAAFDLICCADCLNYFGCLEQVLTAALRALRPLGSIVFSLETMVVSAGGQRPYRLEAHGRFAHDLSYVQSVLERAAGVMTACVHAAIRSESGVAVDGLFIAARRA